MLYISESCKTHECHAIYQHGWVNLKRGNLWRGGGLKLPTSCIKLLTDERGFQLKWAVAECSHIWLIQNANRFVAYLTNTLHDYILNGSCIFFCFNWRTTSIMLKIKVDLKGTIFRPFRTSNLKINIQTKRQKWLNWQNEMITNTYV